jgi:cytochrome c-type biogenesis protein CcmH/NrfF
MDLIATFLAGAILSWALPICLLIAITIWWVYLVRRSSSED